ncbi:transporter substrate-binding domain-containing protein [Niallia sp. JL1B1071]|uniref:transporter substrate-binding domain-containing protein n=1 Tax=Niallia tiangongensis TaxID=3237105 RepID=UPI0037DC1888
MRNKLTLFMVLIVSAMFLLAGCGTSSDSASGSKEDNTFKVGMEAGYAPFNWTQNDDSNGAVKIKGSSEYAGGYDVEIAKKVAEGLGKELVIVKTEWDGLVPGLVSGKIDAIIAGMSPTAERKETIDFSGNYYTSNLVMVVKKGSKFENATSIQDFKGAKITAQLNTFHYSVIDQMNGVEKKTAMDNFPAMRVALESGVIDGYVSERPEGVSASAANDKFVMVEFKDGFKTSEEETTTAVGLQKGSDLTEKINKILADIPDEERTSMMDNAIKNQPAAE